MGRGSSGAGGKKAGGGAAKTPSGVTYNQFMQMTDDQKYNLMNSIISDTNLQTPDTMDNSDTSKVLYALGVTNKPTVVDDATLDGMSGKEIYRTVYEAGTMPPPSSGDILDQIRNGDYTYMSGRGGSAHGRAIYFATDFSDSRTYGDGERNAMMMRAKINPNAKIVREDNLANQMRNDTTWQRSNVYSNAGHADEKALYAIAHGIDGWYSNTYTMMVNRGALTASSKNKRITQIGKGVGQTKTGRLKRGVSYARSWAGAEDAN